MSGPDAGAPGAGGLVITVTRRARFASARSLRSAGLDAASNQRLFGRWQGLHGHDFTLHVTLGGTPPPVTGMVMDLKALSRLLREVVGPLDGACLDRAPLLGGWPATTENLTAAIWRALEPRLPSGALVEVSVWEGDERGAAYRGE